MTKRIRKKPKKQPIYNHTKVKNKAPIRFRTSCEYDFLQYIRIVFRWALDNYPEINRARLELLLYLYPKGVFTRHTFLQFYKIVGLYGNGALNQMATDGWIKVWRPAKKGNHGALFCLTRKGKVLCTRMHKMLAGEEDIPESPNNATYRNDKQVRMSYYYMEIIKKMNKSRQDSRKGVVEDLSQEKGED